VIGSQHESVLQPHVATPPAAARRAASAYFSLTMSVMDSMMSASFSAGLKTRLYDDR
jgi:hypothetical protein